MAALAAHAAAADGREGGAGGEGNPAGTQPSPLGLGLVGETVSERVAGSNQFTSGSFKATMSFSSYAGVLPEQRASVGSFGAEGANVVTGFHVRGEEGDGAGEEGDENV